MEYILLVSFGTAFLTTFLTIPYWISRVKKAGLVGKDMHKRDKKEVAEIGGIVVLLGFLLGVFTYVALRTFYFKTIRGTLQIMAILSTILIITMIGLIDDILGWKIGLKQWQKPLLTLFAALPMMVVNLGQTNMFLPFLGPTNLGIFYPIFIIPIIIIGASNGFNLLAGYNGLEAGLGIIIMTTLGIVAYKTSVTWLSVIALCMVFALIAFFFYNKYPARIFPGDTLTYLVGALIACIAIIGNMEKIALILFIPFIVEFILKIRGRFKKESFAKLAPNGSLVLPYKKMYGLEHFAIFLLSKIKSKVSENNVVYSLLFVELLLAVIVLRMV